MTAALLRFRNVWSLVSFRANATVLGGWFQPTWRKGGVAVGATGVKLALHQLLMGNPLGMGLLVGGLLVAKVGLTVAHAYELQQETHEMSSADLNQHGSASHANSRDFAFPDHWFRFQLETHTRPARNGQARRYYTHRDRPAGSNPMRLPGSRLAKFGISTVFGVKRATVFDIFVPMESGKKKELETAAKAESDAENKRLVDTALSVGPNFGM